MIKPAICYKEQLDRALAEYFYTDDMMFYIGDFINQLLKIDENPKKGRYQYAVLDSKESLIGYIAYDVDYYSSSAYNFGAFSFDRGNPVMGKELFNIIEDLIQRMHRVEFRAISGNPAIRGYDSLLNRHSDIGYRHVLEDVFKDENGQYHDIYIYEFVQKGGAE